MDKKVINMLLIIILSVSVFFRLYNLGYSNFQGDEVAAQNYLFGEQSFKDFLLTRTIGPGQFLVSASFNKVFGTFNPEFFVRLPFFAANVATLFFVFSITKKEIGEIESIIVSVLIGLSGLLIAFSKIVQYQSFILMLSILSIYFAYKYQILKREKYIYISAIFSAIAFLFHYDALSFIFPIILVLLVKKDFKALLKYGLTSAAVCSVFYIPFVLRYEFISTAKYLFLKRISSGFEYDPLYYSLKLMSIYHSKEFIIFTVLIALILLYRNIKWEIKKENIILAVNVLLIMLRVVLQNKVNWLFYASNALFLIYIIMEIKNIFQENKLSFENFTKIWFLTTFFFYGMFFSMPLTHIYTFFIPAAILMSKIANEKTYLNPASWTLLFFIVISAISFNSAAFTNTRPEYPWNPKKYIFGEMPKNIIDGEDVKGIFGFPYDRKWYKIREIALKLKSENGYEKYKSNEKYRLTKYYMQNFQWEEEAPDFYIYVRRPQSLDKSSEPNDQIIYQEESFAIYKLGNAQTN